MDDLDFAILNHLQEDGRKPFTEIAKALGVTEGTIRTVWPNSRPMKPLKSSFL